MATRPHLNEDIYEMILDIVEDPPTVSAMMQTCTTLYTIGVKYLLSFEVIIESVARYLWSLNVLIEWSVVGDEGDSESPGSASSHLEWFADIDVEELQSVQMLVQILRAATNLDILGLTAARDHCRYSRFQSNCRTDCRRTLFPTGVYLRGA
ncbi:hypothetical protein OH77DRAFT_1073042 [Trametes cingulata]|nr:hypothetical protein OH77DRAFT_1073042 [Trametes cingulata]